jgi:hypothetical protein
LPVEPLETSAIDAAQVGWKLLDKPLAHNASSIVTPFVVHHRLMLFVVVPTATPAWACGRLGHPVVSRLAVRFLIHYIDDMHQLCHFGDSTEKGGNRLGPRSCDKCPNLDRL